MQQIAFYGKGGIGKTTVATTLAILFARSGAKVLQVGCDPKGDSSFLHTGGQPVRTVMDAVSSGAMPTDPMELIVRGQYGVDFLETGGPEPGIGCAGRGISKMFEVFQPTDAFSRRYEIILFDVLGDVVCGGFAAPIRSGRLQDVYIVVSGEVLALYAANNICRAVLRYAASGIRVGGLIANLRGIPGEEAIIGRFAAALGIRFLHPIPRDVSVQQAEFSRTPLPVLAPDAELIAHYRLLAEEIRSTTPADRVVPAPLSAAAFSDLLEDLRPPFPPGGLPPRRA